VPNQPKFIAGHSVRRSGEELKFQVLQISTQIIVGAKTALVSKEKYNSELFGWGGIIESFDSFIGIYYQTDEKYYKIRRNIKTKILKLNAFDETIKNKLLIKRLYDTWFRLICIKLAAFKIFPPLPVSYAQAIGELTEELSLLARQENE